MILGNVVVRGHRYVLASRWEQAVRAWPCSRVTRRAVQMWRSACTPDVRSDLERGVEQ